VNSYDESKFIKETISDLENNMFSGFVLVLLVTIFFLGFRNALFVSLAIPFSMLISFFVLQAMGITLNMIVLFSLIIALGMLVDNGIVAVENIFRHATMGKTRFRAAVDGIKEIAMPMLSSTLTTCLAFFPIVFMPGIMGDFMSYLPITIIVVLAASFFVAVTINPVFCSLFLGVSERDRKKLVEGSGAFVRVQDLYTRMAGRAVARPWLFIGITTAVVAAGFAAYGIIGKEPVFFPETDPSTAIVNLETRQGTPLDRTDALTRRIEAALPGIETSLEHAQAVVGGNGEDDHKATVRVEFRSYMEREPSGAKSTENLKAALKGFPGAKITFEEIENGPPSGHPVSYEIVGEDYGVLGSIAERIVGILESHPELKGIQSDYERPSRSWRSRWTGPKPPTWASPLPGSRRQSEARSTGPTPAATGTAPKSTTSWCGSRTGSATPWISSGASCCLPTRGPGFPWRASPRCPSSRPSRSSRGRTISARWRSTPTSSPMYTNKAEIGGEIGKAVKAIKLPAGYRIETGEGVQVQQESTVFLLRAFVIALFLIAAVLIVQFNSVVDPLIIMSSVFLSLGGIFWGYALTGQVFVVIMTGIGCISLAGVVVNNAIILIDYVNQLIKGGTPWREAIVLSGRTRLRPVILTAITTVLGMIPMALGASFDVHTFAFVVGSEQSEFWQSFAWAMIYGLSFATVMTLVIVPALLSVKFSVLDRIAARKAGKARPAEAGAAQAS
jgi:multidrug efflux pump subunit AcrB